MILTNKGYKKISEIKCGDMVLSYNIENKLYEFKTVTNTFKNEYKGEMINIQNNTTKITCTPNHKIFTQNRGYVEAENLSSNDELVRF